MTIIKHRRGTAAEWAASNRILENGEIGFERDTNKLKIGDGIATWENLVYIVDENLVKVLAEAAAGEASTAAVSEHEAAENPHSQYALGTALTQHAGRKDNPHSVSKYQVGLANVDNTSDADKPVSTAQQQMMTDHEASEDPHPQYLTQGEGDSAFLTQGEGDSRYPVIPGNVIVPTIATNLLPRSAPLDLAGFTTVVGGLVDDADSVRGKAIESTSGAIGQNLVQPPNVTLTDDMKGRPITISLDAKLISSPSPKPLLRFSVYFSGPNVLVSSPYFKLTETRQRFSWSQMVPEGTTWMYMRVQVWGTDSPGTVIRTSGYSIGTKDYLDGDMEGAMWAGTPHASPSHRIFHSGYSDAQAAIAAASALPVSARYFEGEGFPEGAVDAPVGSRYIDRLATNGAIEWIKKSGTGNTGWRVRYGDTGLRALVRWSGGVVNFGTMPAGWSPGFSDGYIRVRRTADKVTYLVAGIQCDVNGSHLGYLEVGLRPRETHVFLAPVDTSTPSTIKARRFSILTSGMVAPYLNAGEIITQNNNSNPASFSFETDDPWPTVLPGTPA